MSFERVLAEFVSSARRAGLVLSPVESIDVQRAAMAVGLERRDDLRAALRAVMVKSPDAAMPFERTFEAFFTAEGRQQGSLFDRLESQGFSRDELAALRTLLEQMGQQGGGGTGVGALAQGGAELDRLLFVSGREAGIDRMQTPMQVGFYTQRVLEAAGLSNAQSALGALRNALRDALGDRADALTDAVTAELERFRQQTRSFVQDEFRRRNSSIYDELRKQRLHERSFSQLAPNEVEQIAAEVRRLAQRLRGAQAVRRKRMRRGVLDVRRTLRRSFRTGAVPFQPVLRRRRRDRPKLVVLCDVSDSVRFAARFLLLFVYSIQEVFARTRTFVFVSDVGETTDLFKAHPPDRAIQLAYGGGIISVASNSNYGRAFGSFRERFLESIDRRTTVLIVGDGRSNYFDPNEAALRDIGRRARRVVWMNPEPRGAWGFGDSAMLTYDPLCDSVLTVHNLETLRESVTELIRLR